MRRAMFAAAMIGSVVMMVAGLALAQAKKPDAQRQCGTDQESGAVAAGHRKRRAEQQRQNQRARVAERQDRAGRRSDATRRREPRYFRQENAVPAHSGDAEPNSDRNRQPC